jgi:membrane protein implicated in regulation of membrane protease activity
VKRVGAELLTLGVMVLIFGGLTSVFVVWHPWWAWRGAQAIGAFVVLRFVVRQVRRRQQAGHAEKYVA